MRTTETRRNAIATLNVGDNLAFDRFINRLFSAYSTDV
jgi:hypothetical protein